MKFVLTPLRFLAPIVIVGLGVYVLMTFGAPMEAKSSAPEDTGATLVEVATVEAHDGPFHIEVDGEAVSSRIVKVAAEIGGRVIQKPVTNQAGLFVAEDAVLFEIDPTDYELEVVRLEAQLAQATERIKENDVSLANAETLVEFTEAEWAVQKASLDRLENLQTQRAATKTNLDRAIRDELIARKSKQSLSNEIRLLKQKHASLAAERDLVKAQLMRAKRDVSRATVKAPFGGTVIADTSEVGDYVKAGDKLVDLSDTTTMEVKCELRVDDLIWVWQQGRNRESFDPEAIESRLELPETPVEVIFEFRDTALIWNGVLSRYEGVGLDKDTRTVPCRVHVDEPGEARLVEGSGTLPVAAPPSLLSGMFVKVRIPIESPNPLVRLPHRAIRPGGRTWLVEDGQLFERAVTVVRDDDQFALVEAIEATPDGADGLAGVRDGSQVVTSPLPGITDGMAVRVRSAE